MRDQARDHKVNSVLETARIVTGVRQNETFLAGRAFLGDGGAVSDVQIYFILVLELLANLRLEVCSLEKGFQLGGSGKGDLVALRYHTLTVLAVVLEVAW